ncbi:hypothetical protein HWV62_42138 [Athelia sp. TMB]|nr:hypothetical protein HWV62_42138 [Athelia sp. TMB]
MRVKPIKDTPTPQVDTKGMLSGSGTELKYTHPADMTADDWNVVLLTNSLLNGLTFDPKRKTLKIAREPAFQLKYSYPDPFNNTAGADPTKATAGNSKELCVPAFRVTDDSSVTITLLKNSIQKSMAKQSFSSWEIEAAVSGGYGPISGEASGGYSESSTKAFNESTTEKNESILAAYNFPRVTLILDPDNLELSESCKKFFDIKPFDPDKFFAKFGEHHALGCFEEPQFVHSTFDLWTGIIFPCSVLLGARLESTNQSTLFTKDTEKKSDEEKKAKYSASISSPWVSASSSGAMANRNQSNDQTSEENSSVNMHWEARGGETHLSTNPPAWIRTITPYRNWRVIERDDVRNVLDMVKAISPNITYLPTRSIASPDKTGSPTSTNVYAIPSNKTWRFANSDRLISTTSGINFKASGKIETQIDDFDFKDDSRTTKEWIVKFSEDKKWITIASFRKNLESHELYYITPKAVSDGSQVELAKGQAYQWQIKEDSGSALAVLRMLTDHATRSIYLPNGGGGGAQYLALTTVTGADSKLEVQLKPLNSADDKQKWSAKEGGQSW